MEKMEKLPPVDTDAEDQAWSRAMLLRELRKPLVLYRWEWVGNFLWPKTRTSG